MRSRYGHDGSVDAHAESEHEILRRADEALERRRLNDHAECLAGQGALGAIASPLGKSESAGHGAKPAVPGIPAPKMPHEDLIASLTPNLSPPTVATEWPSQTQPKIASSSRSRRSSR